MILSDRVSGSLSMWGILIAGCLAAALLPAWSLGQSPPSPENGASVEPRTVGTETPRDAPHTPDASENDATTSANTEMDAWTQENLHDENLAGLVRELGTRSRTSRAPARATEVKEALRSYLRNHPDPQVALSLARIIQDQLSTETRYFAPVADGQGGTYWWKTDPTANYREMAELLTMGFNQAPEGTELWRKHGVGLAKLRLLQGDWERMNQILRRLGRPTIATEDRPFLTAPLASWLEDPKVPWTRCDESMRNGTCGLSMQFERGGRPLQGVHVCLREWTGEYSMAIGPVLYPPLFAPFPLPCYWVHDRSFGSQEQSTTKTRYGISDAAGRIEFTHLPAIPIGIEILVPASDFPEPYRAWMLEVGPIPPQSKEDFADEDDPNRGYATWGPVVKLRPGRTVQYPLCRIYPVIELGFDDHAEIQLADADNFVLTWPVIERPAADVTYDVVMGRYVSDRHPLTEETTRGESFYLVDPVHRTLRTNRLEVGREGIDGKQLEVGKVYGFQVTASDTEGRVLARSDVQRLHIVENRIQSDGEASAALQDPPRPRPRS